MFRSDYSDYESLCASDHSSFASEQPLSTVVEISSDEIGGVSLQRGSGGRNVSALLSSGLSPNKRAIIEAMLTHWINQPSEHQLSKSGLPPQDPSVSSTYSSSVQSSGSSSLHSIERHAS